MLGIENQPTPPKGNNRRNNFLGSLQQGLGKGKDAVFSMPRITNSLIERFLKAFKNPYLASKSYRFLAQQIGTDLGVGNGAKVIVFSSISSARSSNEILLMLSHFLKDELGCKVRIVDATFTHTGVTETLNKQDASGFLDYLYSENADLDAMIIPVGTGRIGFLPLGKSGALTSFIEHDKIDRFLAEIACNTDYILIQQSAIQADTRNLMLAKKADLFLLHMEEKTTPISAFEAASEILNEQRVENVRYLVSEI
jgi:hypothetical protein